MIGSGALKWVKLNPLLGVVQSQSQVWGAVVVVQPSTPSRQLLLSFRLRRVGPEARGIQHTWTPSVVLRGTAVLEMFAVNSDMSMPEPERCEGELSADVRAAIQAENRPSLMPTSDAKCIIIWKTTLLLSLP